MRFKIILALAIIAACVFSPVVHSQQINPVTQILWPLITGNGTPTSLSYACTTANYGQPYQNLAVTPNTYYTCGNDGWAIRGNASGAGNVTGPGSSTDSDIVLFNGTTGKIIKDSGTLLSSLASLSGAAFTGAITAPVTNGHQTVGPATGSDAAIISAAITAAGKGGVVDLTPGQLYVVNAQIALPNNFEILNFNGSCIESTYTGGDSLLVSGSFNTINQPCMVPGAAIQYAAIDDTGWGLTINGGGVYQLSGNSPKNGQYWYWNLEYTVDEQATLNSWNSQANFTIPTQTGQGSQATLRCDSTFCGAGLYNPAGSSNAAILTSYGSTFSMGCSGNSIDWEGDNALYLNDVTTQSYNQYGIKIRRGAAGAASNTINGWYDSPTGCGTGGSQQTLGNPAMNGNSFTTPLVLGPSVRLGVNGASSFSYGQGNGVVSHTCTGTCTTTNYGWYVVIHSNGSSTLTTVPIGFGSIVADSAFASTTANLLIPTSPGTGDTCDILRVSATGSNPIAPIYGSATPYAIPTAQGLACDPSAGTYITFTDSTPNSSLTAYSWPSAGTVGAYGPEIGLNGWPGAGLILAGTATGGHAEYTGPCSVAPNIIIPDYTGTESKVFASCTNNVEEGYSTQPYFPNTPNIIGKPAGGFNYSNQIVSAHLWPAWYRLMGSGFKGELNFGPNNSTYPWAGGPTDIITLIDSNPFKTLATVGNHPPADPGDTAIGVDNGVNGLAFRDPVSISGYINSLADGYSYAERLTAVSKSLWTPTNVYNALNVSQVTAVPTLGAFTQNSAIGHIAASTTTCYRLVGLQKGGLHGAAGTESCNTVGSSTNTNATQLNFTPPSSYTYVNVYVGPSNNEVGPCNFDSNNNVAPIPSYGRSYVDYTGTCLDHNGNPTGTAYPTSSTMPAASITLNGGTPWTSSSSANSQVVTCPSGGTTTQYCDAAGAWVTPSSGGGTTTNALTAAASGGAAPNSTFNGSAAVTFDYHSFGAQVAGSYAPASGIALSALATQATDTVDMNATGGSAVPTAVAMPTCTTGADLYNTSTHSWSCVSTSGSSGISGLTLGYIPLAGSATTLTGNSHLDDGVTTASTITSTEAIVAPSIAANGSGAGAFTETAGTAPTGAAGKAIYSTDATVGYAEVNENNTGLSRVCTAANGQCGTVTTSGSPVSPNAACFSSSTAITACTSANIQTAIGAGVYDTSGAAAGITLVGLGGVPTTTTVNGHALSSNVVVSASDITTGTLPHAQLPTLVSGDIPNNAANTSGTAANITATSNATLATLSALTAAAGGTFASGAFAAAYTLPSQYKTWSVSDGAVSTAALPTSGFPAVVFGPNGTGGTQTITTITCYVDGGTGTTFTLVDNSGNNLLGATGTCSTSGATTAVSGTHSTIASAGYMKYTLTPDGTAKAVTIAVSGTY